MNEKINELYNTLDAKDNIINQQALEIARLKERIEININAFLYQSKKINKAIKWVHKHIYKYNCKGITIIDWDELSNPNDLLEILGDKE